ncbi:MAG TPA: selenocysteine-specific translation elongation factor [Thermoleophilaceae bacterium]|nr:selenocysteine-specific translation elongation factor [Thermoleophilaceae bacterium]
MTDAPLTLGTAGHIDHGKTALVRALTGRDTDRLPEEHRRGISIELGYARLELPSGRTLSVVDVPGHERFVRTMVAGATGIDLFLVCVAADDGVMPQTREHMAVLRQLGVEQGVVAITKSDVADPEMAAAEAAELVPAAEVVPVSALRGEGLGDLRDALDRAAAATRSRAVDGDVPARLHVDRSFTLKGIGTVVTGTLWSGSIAGGDQVQILPARMSARVRSVQVHDEPVERAAAGQRVALNLAGIHRDEVGRGDVVLRGGAIKPTHIVDARFGLEPGTPPLEPGTRVQIHHGTRESAARLYPLGEQYVQMRLESPIVAERGDHVIIRQVAPPDTIGGAVVIDANARRHSARPGLVERLRFIEAGGDPDAAARTAKRRGVTPQDGGRGGNADAARARGDAERAVLDPAALAIREVLRADGERPRTDAELAAAAGLDPAAAAAALRALEADGSATRVARNLHFDSDVVRALVARVVAICERDGSATIAAVRDELGTSRKYAQAILEHMDATKVTLRRDEVHVLRRR